MSIIEIEKRGTKRRCLSCNNFFYDLGSPEKAVCPICGVGFEKNKKPTASAEVINRVEDEEIEEDVLAVSTLDDSEVFIDDDLDKEDSTDDIDIPVETDDDKE